MPATSGTPSPTGGWRDLYVSSRDGLRLHARDYGDRASPWGPVICLPGLTRNAADFHELASHLANHRHRPRRVLALSFRGRGLSEHDRDWRNYTPQTEASDVLDVMVAAGVPHAAFVGTSRGGLVIMRLAAMRPSVLKAAVLNDIGPEIDQRGMLRIKKTLEGFPRPASWEEASEFMKRAYGHAFPRLGPDDWMAYARKTYLEHEGRPALAYDPALRRHLNGIAFDRPLPAIWPLFAALANVPLMAIRGANSDILAAETLAEMAAQRPDLDVFEVADAGHPPHLVSNHALSRVSRFLTRAEDDKP